MKPCSVLHLSKLDTPFWLVITHHKKNLNENMAINNRYVDIIDIDIKKILVLVSLFMNSSINNELLNMAFLYHESNVKKIIFLFRGCSHSNGL